MRALHITLKDLRVAYRDRTGLLLLLAMPLVLIAVLGVVFGGAFAETPTIQPFAIGVVDLDHSHLSGILWDVVSGSDLQDLLVAKQLTQAEAEEQIRQGKLVGALVIPAGFDASVTSGQSAISLLVLSDPGAEFQVNILQSFAQAFVDQLTAVRVAAVEVLSSGQPVDFNQLAAQVNERVMQARVTLQEEAVAPGVTISSFQYYAFAMACMFLLMSGSLGLQSLATEQRNQTYARTMVTPTSKFSYLVGKVGGQVAISFVQFLILVAGTSVGFGVYWGNWPAVLLTGFAYALTVGGLSVLVSSLVSNAAAAVGGWMIAVQIFTALGGGMVPLTQFPGFMQRVAMVSPVYWGLKSFLALGVGQGVPWQYVLPLFGVGIIAISLGLWRLSSSEGVL